MKRLQKRLNSLSIKEIDNQGSVHGLGDFGGVECYFSCMNYCNSACDTACAPKCNIGYDSFEAFYAQSNALGQTGYSAYFWLNLGGSC